MRLGVRGNDGSRGCVPGVGVNDDPIEAHRHSIRHRAEVESSSVCGCFYCLAIVKPSAIVRWVDSEDTAICPKCGIDSILGDASQFPITPEFLQRMRDRWF